MSPNLLVGLHYLGLLAVTATAIAAGPVVGSWVLLALPVMLLMHIIVTARLEALPD